MNPSINHGDITFLVHGPNIPFSTKKCLENIRLFFPNSKIIFSTWKNENIDALTFDQIIYNEDPGSEAYNAPKFSVPCSYDTSKFEFTLHDKHFVVTPKKNNINRMLKTIKEALPLVETQYICKIRSDLILTNNTFLQYWDIFPKYHGEFKLFKHRILNNNLYAQFAHVMDKGIQFLPFHISDWFLFGYTDDIKKLFSCDYQNINDASHYWETRKRLNFDPFEDALWRYPTEEYICYELVKKHFPYIKFDNSDDYNAINMQQSNKFIVDNFIMLDSDMISMKLKKYPNEFYFDSCIYNGFITYRQWQWLYRTYCDNSYEFWNFDFKRLKAILIKSIKNPFKIKKNFKDFGKSKILNNYFIKTRGYDEH